MISKYYPPDFDPAKVPRGKRAELNMLKVRMMLPMSIRCGTCGTFMAKVGIFSSFFLLSLFLSCIFPSALFVFFLSPLIPPLSFIPYQQNRGQSSTRRRRTSSGRPTSGSR